MILPTEIAATDALNPADLDREGFAILPRLLDPDQIAELGAKLETALDPADPAVLKRADAVYGVRDLLARVPEVRELAKCAAIRAIVERIAGAGAFCVRALYFDKTQETNWNLPWHQDLTIAVRSRKEAPGFGPWTRKAGIDHAHAPDALLERMLTVRVHLDECGPASGPMRVLPGSHREGRLDRGRMAAWIARSASEAVDCLVPAGGGVVMRPLLLHASAQANAAGRRRVIHLEFASEPLPAGLEWLIPES